MQDAVQKRRLMGIGRVDLVNRKVDFQPIGPATPVFPFAKSPDGKRAYGLIQDIGHYEMWTFDLEKNEVAKRTEFEGRPRMGLRVSSNGKFVYVYVAGATVDIWDAATHKYLRTMALGGDQTTELFVVPAADTHGHREPVDRAGRARDVLTRPTRTCVGRLLFWRRTGGGSSWSWPSAW